MTPLLGILSRVTSMPWPYSSPLRADLSSLTSLVSFRTSTAGSLKLVSTQVGIFDPLSISFEIISFTLGSAFFIDVVVSIAKLTEPWFSEEQPKMPVTVVVVVVFVVVVVVVVVMVGGSGSVTFEQGCCTVETTSSKIFSLSKSSSVKILPSDTLS